MQHLVKKEPPQMLGHAVSNGCSSFVAADAHPDLGIDPLQCFLSSSHNVVSVRAKQRGSWAWRGATAEHQDAL
jgi:hypothetical protein